MLRLSAFLILLVALVSCSPDSAASGEAGASECNPVEPVAALLTDFDRWWDYHYNRVDLSVEFRAVDEHRESISKDVFLQQLTTGNYITVELDCPDDQVYYRLYPIDAAEQPAIAATLKSVAALERKRYRMEGMAMPAFDVTDLDGNKLTNAELADGYTVFKTWFIACKPCITEMPELNKLVAEYAGREDVRFVSLALDDEGALRDFLEKTNFDYAVVPEQRTLIQKELHLNVFPTHFVVGPDGKLLKVVGKVDQLRNFLATL